MNSNEIHRISMAAGDAAEAFRKLGETVKTRLEKNEDLSRFLREVREAEECEKKKELIQIAKQENRDFIERKCRKCR